MQCRQEDRERVFVDSFAPGTPCHCEENSEDASPAGEEVDGEMVASSSSWGVVEVRLKEELEPTEVSSHTVCQHSQWPPPSAVGAFHAPTI